MSIKSVVLVGAGGNLGPSILEQLLQSSLRVTVLSRRSSEHTFPSNVDVIKISDDYPQEELVKALKGHDAVVSTITPNQKSLIDASIEAGVKRFIPSEFGSDNTGAEAQRIVPAWREKADIRAYLKSKESSTFSWTAVATNPFFDWAFRVTKASFLRIDVKNKKALVLNDGNLPWSASNLRQVGLAVRRVLERPELTRNKLIFIESFTITQNQLLAGLERELGITFEREMVPGKEFLAQNAEKSAAGDIGGLYAAMIGFTFLGGSFKDQTDYANGLLDLPLEDVDRSIKEAAEALKV